MGKQSQGGLATPALWGRAEAGTCGLEEASGKAWSVPKAVELHGAPSGWIWDEAGAPL